MMRLILLCGLALPLLTACAETPESRVDLNGRWAWEDRYNCKDLSNVIEIDGRHLRAWFGGMEAYSAHDLTIRYQQVEDRHSVDAMITRASLSYSTEQGRFTDHFLLRHDNLIEFAGSATAPPETIPPIVTTSQDRQLHRCPV